jgi:hypothetical protein
MSVMETSGNSQANITVALPRRGGRPKGSRNKRTIAVEQAMRKLLPKSKLALVRLLTDAKVADDVRFKAAALVYGYVFGKPTERREVSGPDGKPIEQSVFTKHDAEGLIEPLKEIYEKARGKSK